MFLGGAPLAILPGGWFPTVPRGIFGASLKFLVTGADHELLFSGVKATGVQEDLVIYYRQSTGSTIPATLRIPNVDDGPFSAQTFVPVSTGYVCRIVATVTRAWALGQATAA
jgi:ureidoglycolate hydrolase